MSAIRNKPWAAYGCAEFDSRPAADTSIIAETFAQVRADRPALYKQYAQECRDAGNTTGAIWWETRARRAEDELTKEAQDGSRKAED